MRKTFHVKAVWDPEARVWASQGDVPGLVIETATLAEFEALLHELAPQMIADNEGKNVFATIEWTASGAFDTQAA